MVIDVYTQMGYKAEATELTPETLAAAQFATVFSECDLTDDSKYNARAPRRASFSVIPGVGGTTIAKVSGTLEPTPSGTDGTAPLWYALAAAAGGVVTGDVVTFGAVGETSSVIGTAVTFKYRNGEYERVSAGTRLSKMRWYAKNGEIWQCEIEGTGRYSEGVQTAFVTGANPVAGLGRPFLGNAISVGAFSGSVGSAEVSIENTVTPAPDGTHASGFGRNVITAQATKAKVAVLAGATDWRAAYRAGTKLATSIQISTGTAGNVLTFTGDAVIVEDPTAIEYIDGIGYTPLSLQFVSEDADASLTLTQS